MRLPFMSDHEHMLESAGATKNRGPILTGAIIISGNGFSNGGAPIAARASQLDDMNPHSARWRAIKRAFSKLPEVKSGITSLAAFLSFHSAPNANPST